MERRKERCFFSENRVLAVAMQALVGVCYSFIIKLLNALLLIVEICFLVLQCFYGVLYHCYRLVIPKRKKSLENQLILITGSGHGLGRELALECGKHGARLVLWDINKANNEKVANEVRALNVECHEFQCDVTNEKQVAETRKYISNNIGTVDILINNAGIAHCESIFSLKNEQIRNTLNVNVLSHFYTIKQFLPEMKQRKSGHIVSIASVAGLVGSPFLTDYCASKFAAVGFMMALEQELESLGLTSIKLTTVCPVFINTGLFKNVHSRFPQLLPMLDSQDVARVIVEGIRREHNLVVIPRTVHLLYQLLKPMPHEVHRLVQRFVSCSLQK